MNFIVRDAVATDIEELTRLRTERMEVYLKAEKRLQTDLLEWRTAMLSWLTHPQAKVQVVDREGQIIGYMVGWLWDTPPMVSPSRVGIITEMTVDGHCKQGGVGSAMLKSLSAWFKTQGLTSIEVRVPRLQPIEQAFWQAVGAKSYVDHFYYQLG